MRIGIDAGPMTRSRGGVGWHTYHLLRSLIELKTDDVEYVAYVEPGTLGGLAQKEPWVVHPNLQWKEVHRWMMSWQGRRDGLDLFHGPNFKLRTRGRYGGVVTIHDLWLDRFPQYSRKALGQAYSFRRSQRMALRAAKVITVSKYSARDIAELYGVPNDRIAVIYNGVSDDFQPGPHPVALDALRRRFGWGTDPYILFVGGADPRKNHETLVRAYASRLNALKAYRLVMVGPCEHRFGNIANTAAACGVSDRLVCTGPLDVDDLRVLYAHAEVFVFPSIYEGFGMPVLEAMACGAPVVTSNTTSLSEVAGDAAALVDARSVEGLAETLVRVMEDPVQRATLRAKGFARSKAFTWRRAACETLAVYRDICGAPMSSAR
jgi:glycosyltransferase involved in cell wall biosynthesis